MIKKITTTIGLFIITFIIMAQSIPVSFAQGSTGAGFTCDQVQASQSDSIYVILEEPLAVKESNDTKFCFRVCSKDAKTTNICKIKPTCETDNDIGSSFSCQRIQVIKTTSGTDLIFIYVRMIYLWAAGIIGIISVFTFVYNGILISAAGGDSAKIETAKGRIMQSLVGLVVLFLSGLILYTINPTFFV